MMALRGDHSSEAWTEGMLILLENLENVARGWRCLVKAKALTNDVDGCLAENRSLHCMIQYISSDDDFYLDHRANYERVQNLAQTAWGTLTNATELHKPAECTACAKVPSVMVLQLEFRGYEFWVPREMLLIMAFCVHGKCRHRRFESRAIPDGLRESCVVG